jgi:predicted Holliday junction resolvase-like endonuclease
MDAIAVTALILAAASVTSTILLGFFLIASNKTIKEVRQTNADNTDKITDLIVNNEQLQKGNRELQNDLFNAQDELGIEREKNRQLLSQKKSSETRLGQISEHIVPFLSNCPYDPKNLHFMGNPVDYVCFDFDQGCITFIEVKSGNSKPSKRQKIVKNIVKTGRVYYDEIRINEKGVRRKHVSGYDNRPHQKFNRPALPPSKPEATPVVVETKGDQNVPKN